MSVRDIVEKIDDLLENGTGDTFPSEKLKYIKWVIKESNPKLIPDSAIKNALNQLHNAKRHANNPTQVGINIDAIVSLFSSPWNKKRPKAESQKIIDEIRENANAAIADALKKLETVESELQEKNDELKNLDATVLSMQGKIEVESQRLDSMVTNEQAALASKKAKIDEDNSAFIEKTKKEITDKADTEVGSFKTKLESEIETLKSDISTLRTDAESDQSKIRDLLKIASDDILTKDYSDLSHEEKKPAKNWSILAAVSFFCVPVTAIFLAFFYGIPDNLNLNALWVRFSLPFSFLIVGVYASKKSSHHRDTHLHAKRTHIRFSTLEPYLEKFNPEKRDEIREELIGEFFKEKNAEKIKTPFIGFNLKQVTDLIKEIRSSVTSG